MGSLLSPIGVYIGSIGSCWVPIGFLLRPIGSLLGPIGSYWVPIGPIGSLLDPIEWAYWVPIGSY